MEKKAERIEKLIKILKIRNYVSAKELSTLLGVSEMTIRRDLKFLQSNNIAENVNGTLVYNPSYVNISNENIYDISDEASRHNPQKEAIGKYAATMIGHNDIIIIDTGTTTEKIVPHLPINMDITVLCYNINILMELRRIPGIDIIFSGGYYHPNTQMFVSDEGIQLIKNIRAQKVFISAAGIHNNLGITCANNYEVQTKKAILSSSLEKILVADSSKFGNVRSSYFCDLDSIDTIITDSNLSSEWQEIIRDLEITLHIV